MKIDKVIMSCDDKRYYLDFWPLVSKVWKQKFNIHPVLILFGDKKELNVSEEFGTVIEFKTLDGEKDGIITRRKKSL